MGVIEAKSLPSETNGELVTDLTSESVTEVQYKVVPIDGLGKVRLKTLSADALLNMPGADDEDNDAILHIICECVVDGNGHKTHTHDEETLAKLRRMRSPVFQQLVTEINAFVLAETNVEDAVGN